MDNDNELLNRVLKSVSRTKIEIEEDWVRWANEIPFIKFKAEWEVQVIPPMIGAIARFRVKTDEENIVSVYLDCYNRLGHFNGPYWEVFPYRNDVGRCGINEVDELLRMIEDRSGNE